MAGQSWVVNIVPASGSVALNPDVYGAPPGSPLQAQVGDIVTWCNQTDDSHAISVSGESLPAAPWKSTTGYVIQNPNKLPTPFTLNYTCSTAAGNVNGLIDVLS